MIENLLVVEDEVPVDLVLNQPISVLEDHETVRYPDWVSISQGAIRELGFGPPPPSRAVIDVSNLVLTAGLTNVHNHLTQNLGRAYRPALDSNLTEWLQHTHGLWAQCQPEDTYLAAWIGMSELLLGGCTTTVEHMTVPMSGDEDPGISVLRAAEEVGIRVHLVRAMMDNPRNPAMRTDWNEFAPAVHRLVEYRESSAMSERLSIGVGAATLLSTSPEVMSQISELAGVLNVNLHVHISESRDEEAEVFRRHGLSSVRILETLGWLTPDTWIAHGVHLGDDDIDLLATNHVGVAHCPSSNMVLGSGAAPTRRLLDAGVHVGLGTDGAASNDQAFVLGEARMAMLLARVVGGADSMSSSDVFRMATSGGAACIGRSDLGRLSVGATADIAAWSADDVFSSGGVTDPVAMLIRTGPHRPRHVWVAGKRVVEDGDLVAAGLRQKISEHRRVARRIQNLSTSQGS